MLLGGLQHDGGQAVPVVRDVLAERAVRVLLRRGLGEELEGRKERERRLMDGDVR